MYMHTCTQTHEHIHAHRCAHTRMHVHTHHTHAHTEMHTHIHAHTRTCTYTQTHALRHTHACAHTHKEALLLTQWSFMGRFPSSVNRACGEKVGVGRSLGSLGATGGAESSVIWTSFCCQRRGRAWVSGCLDGRGETKERDLKSSTVKCLKWTETH